MAKGMKMPPSLTSFPFPAKKGKGKGPVKSKATVKGGKTCPGCGKSMKNCTC